MTTSPPPSHSGATPGDPDKYAGSSTATGAPDKHAVASTAHAGAPTDLHTQGPPLPRRRALIVIAVASIAAFMTSLDNLVVGVALPSIRTALGGSMEALEWTVNAYTMAFAVLMIAMSALGDRYGRRRVFSAGIVTFTVASALAAMSNSIEMLVAARALQGAGAAAILPLSLTLISGVVPPEKRSAAIGIWGGVSGLGVALGPFVGGAVVEGMSWEWIFWINVPVGIILLPIVLRVVPESRGPATNLDLPGLVLAGAGLLALTFGVVRAPALGWESATVIATLVGGVALLAGFVAWERVARAPMLPLHFFANRGFALTNLLSVAMFFGIFGAIFLLSQFFQTGQGLGPFEAGARTLPWTAMPMFVAPIAGAILYPRFGGRVLMTIGLALQAGAMAMLAAVTAVDVPYLSLVPAFVMAGVGMALVIAPSASMILESVRPIEAGQASGATATLREVGGVFGVAVMATAFQSYGSYESPQEFTDGVVGALPIAVGVLIFGTIAALFLPSRKAHAEQTARMLEEDPGVGEAGAPGAPGAAGSAAPSATKAPVADPELAPAG